MLSKAQMCCLEQLVEEKVAFWRDGNTFRRIVGVSVKPVDLEGDGMPVPVGFLERGYIDLENVDPNDIFACRQVFAD